MRLENFHFGNKVQCCICGGFAHEGVLDRDGPAFKAYYCQGPCSQLAWGVQVQLPPYVKPREAK